LASNTGYVGCCYWLCIGVFRSYYILSPKKATPEKLAPYECGIFPEVEPSQRFPVKFYMVAMLYIVFDIEIIFLFAWATRFNDLGWFGIAAISIFTFFVLETLYYVWKKGVLDWNIPRESDILKKNFKRWLNVYSR
jgi:NADH-quinone oxidoreductase subunit A